jgi:predicted metalloprotease
MGFPPRRAGTGGLGIGAIVVILILAWITGINPLALLGGMDAGGPVVTDQGAGRTTGTGTTGQQGAPADEGGQFISAVLADTEDAWRDLFQKAGAAYQDPTLVLFSGTVDSACGYATAASGPFYCPNDRKVYIDLAFYQELRDRFLAPGDFAQAYVIAHEIGHHVQNLLGDLGQVERLKQGRSEQEKNQLSTRIELQADCYAGIWANSADKRGVLEVGDIDEALNAAAQIGDDAIQQRTRGYVVPESFNHGTSEQRARWFRRGYETGSMAQCDTLSASQL